MKSVNDVFLILFMIETGLTDNIYTFLPELNKGCDDLLLVKDIKVLVSCGLLLSVEELVIGSLLQAMRKEF